LTIDPLRHRLAEIRYALAALDSSSDAALRSVAEDIEEAHELVIPAAEYVQEHSRLAVGSRVAALAFTDFPRSHAS
jgi:hypothetical protein